MGTTWMVLSHRGHHVTGTGEKYSADLPDDPASASGLGCITCGICSAQNGICIVLTWLRIRKPDAGADPERLPTIRMQDELIDCRKNLFGDLFRLLTLTTRQKDREFVATQAGTNIIPAQLCLQKIRDTPQRLIADSVATGVVDLFESVQINEQQSGVSRLQCDFSGVNTPAFAAFSAASLT